MYTGPTQVSLLDTMHSSLLAALVYGGFQHIVLPDGVRSRRGFILAAVFYNSAHYNLDASDICYIRLAESRIVIYAS